MATQANLFKKSASFAPFHALLDRRYLFYVRQKGSLISAIFQLQLTFYWIIGIIEDYHKKNLRELLLSKKKANHSGKIKRELGEAVTLMCGFSKDQ